MSKTSGDELPDLLARLSFEVVGRLSRLASEEEMSLTQLRMLAILRDRRLRMAELAAALGTDRSSTSGLIGRAERRGLVSREQAAEDKRGYTVSLSHEGHAFARRVEERSLTALEPLLQHLGSSDRRTLTALLGRVLEQ